MFVVVSDSDRLLLLTAGMPVGILTFFHVTCAASLLCLSACGVLLSVLRGVACDVQSGLLSDPQDVWCDDRPVLLNVPRDVWCDVSSVLLSASRSVSCDGSSVLLSASRSVSCDVPPVRLSICRDVPHVLSVLVAVVTFIASLIRGSSQVARSPRDYMVRQK